MTLKVKSCFYATVAVAALAMPVTAFAAEAAADAVENPTPRTEPSEILVTATRREQALQDVPIAVTALGGETLDNARIRQTSDLVMQVPNLTISSQVAAFVVFLRGVGNTATNPGQEGAVATYVDGVYQPSPYGALLSLSNIARVEVIKGPQGTLFGRNATGGLINVVTKDPSQEFSGNALISYGNFNTMKATGYITGKLAENVSADIAGYYYNQDKGFGTNVGTGNRLKGTMNLDIRGKVLIEPTDTTKIRIAASYARNTSSTGNALAILPPSTGLGGSALPNFYTSNNFYNINADTDPSSTSTNKQFSLKIDQDAGPFDIVSITSYTNQKSYEIEDADTTTTPILNFIGSQDTNVFTQELQLQSKKGSALTWILGAFYFNSDAKGSPTGVGLRGFAFGCADCGLNSRTHATTKSFAGFGEATYEILPKLNVTVGGRYTTDKKAIGGFTDLVGAGGVITGTFPIAPAEKTFNKFTYRGIVDYHFAEDVMGYASYSRGFKSGGYDTSIPNGIAFAPEVLDAIEAGVKIQALNRRLTLNMAAFHYDYKNLQQPVLIPGTTTQITINAANAKVNGFEADAGLKITENFRVSGGIGYLDSEYKDFDNAPCTALNPVTGAVTGFSCSPSGNQLVQTSKWSWNVGGVLTLPTKAGNFTATASYAYKGTFFYDFTNRLPQKGYGLLNGSLGWSTEDEGFGVNIYAENLTNQKYTIAQYPTGGFPDRVGVGRPRQFGVELRTKF